MIDQPRQKRLMVPRWRSLSLTIRSQELASSTIKQGGLSTANITGELKTRLEAWRRDRNLISAAELVETAIVDGQEPEAISAARFLLADGSRAVPLVQAQAALLLKRAGLGHEVPVHVKPTQGVFKALWRRRTRLYPNSALSWVELALSFTIDGQLDRAKRALQVALNLAPGNRHVLRSASRFFLHNGDELRAYETIAKSTATIHDPWLIAGEIALAEVIDRDPRFYKRAVAMLDDQMLPRQVTELAGSMATKELIEGNKKKARRFFKASMTDPNANALAQAEWASPTFGTELFSRANLHSVDEAFEARANHLFREGQFSEVFLECEGWLENEPYSIRPHELAATTANILDEYGKAEELTRHGLLKRPQSPSLLTSRAYALACLGRFDEAEDNLARMPSDAPDYLRYVAEADRGLIAFRRGETEKGIASYQAAISGFQKEQQSAMVLSATAYMAREMVRAELPEGPRLVESLRTPVANTNSHSIKRVYQATKSILAARAPIQWTISKDKPV